MGSACGAGCVKGGLGFCVGGDSAPIPFHSLTFLPVAYILLPPPFILPPDLLPKRTAASALRTSAPSTANTTRSSSRCGKRAPSRVKVYNGFRVYKGDSARSSRAIVPVARPCVCSVTCDQEMGVEASHARVRHYLESRTIGGRDVIDPTGTLREIHGSQHTVLKDWSFGLGLKPRDDVISKVAALVSAAFDV